MREEEVVDVSGGRRRIVAFAIVSCAALFAAACTSRPSNAGPDGSVTTSIATTAELTTSAPKVPVPSDDERGSATSSSGPDRGGRLVYGVEAESANPWAPYRTSCGTPAVSEKTQEGGATIFFRLGSLL